MHSFSLFQLVNHILETFSWGSKQYISLWCSSDECVEIKNDEQLLEWCEINLQQGTMHINAQINDFDGPLQFSPSKRRLHPKVRSTVCEASQTPPINLNSPHDISQPINMRVQKRKRKGVCHDDEHVGVDEEGMYSDTDSLKALSDSSYDFDLASSSDSDSSDSDFEYNPDAEIVDEDEEDDIAAFAYDANDPCIDVGLMFSDVDQFKSIVTHHAILNDYGFETIKKCSKRFRVKCKRADKGCKWMFFASTSKKYISCKVNVLVYFFLSLFHLLMCCYML
jgi:hypothetical protein